MGSQSSVSQFVSSRLLRAFTTLVTPKISPTDLGVSLALIFNKLLPREPISMAHSMLFDSKLSALEGRVFFFV
jgi:hypothetical protein